MKRESGLEQQIRLAYEQSLIGNGEGVYGGLPVTIADRA